MWRRGWLLIVVALGGLISLMVVAGIVLHRYVGAAQAQIERSQVEYIRRTEVLDGLRTNILTLAIELRDYLLDPASSSATDAMRRLSERRDSILRALDESQRLTGPEDPTRVQHLRTSFDEYWGVIEVALSWTQSEKTAKSAAFLRQKVLPSRNALLAVTAEIGVLNRTTLERRRASIRQDLATIQARILLVFGAAVLMSLLIALPTAVRTRLLEQRAERHRLQTEEAASELRRLSQRLVQAQEDERRSISRELHDEIGQMLTAQKMELDNLHVLVPTQDLEKSRHLSAATGLADQILESVHEMARGLRPAMLDDLGLASALKWHTRQFSRHSGIPVSLQVEGSVDHLPDSHRTCLYRVAQEALTNCARHARAREVRVTLHAGADRLTLTVQDDGIGFDKGQSEGKRLGLLGIEERVKELGGELGVFSQAHHGTLLRVELPLPAETSP